MRFRKRYAGWVIVLVGGVLVFIFGQSIGRFLLGRGLAVAGRLLHARISYERITGNPFSRPNVYGLQVVLGRDSLHVERLELSFDLVALLRRRFSLSNVGIDGPTVYLSTKREEKPSSPKPTGPGPGAFPRVSVGRLTVTRGTVVLDTAVLADSLGLELSLVSGGELVRAGLQGVTGRLPRPGVRVRSLDAAIRLTHDSLRVESLNVMTGQSRAQGRVRMRLETGGAAVTIDNLVLTLPEFSSLPGRIMARGSAGREQDDLNASFAFAAQGLAFGTIALPAVSGRMTLADSVVAFSATGSSPELGAFAVDATLSLQDSSFAGAVTAEDVVVRRFAPGLPDYRVGGRVVCRGRGLDSVAARLSARIPELGIDSLTCQGQLSHGKLNVDWALVSGPLGRVRLQGGYAHQELVASVEIDSLELGYLSGLIGAQLAGRLSGKGSVRSTPNRFALAGKAHATDLAVAAVLARQVAADFDLVLNQGLSGRLAVGAESLAFRHYVCEEAQLLWAGPEFELRVDLPTNRLRAVGVADLDRDRVKAEVEMLEFATERETLTTTRPFQVSYAQESLAVNGVATRLAGATVDLDLTVNQGEAPEVNLRVQQLDLDKLRTLLGLDLELAGIINLDVRGSDTLELALTGKDILFPEMELALSFVDLRLHAGRNSTTINHLKLCRSVEPPAVAETSVVFGQVGYRLDRDSLLSTLELDLRADLRDPGIWVFSFLKPNVELPSGTIYGLISLRGSLIEPAFNGRVRVSRAVLVAPAINTTIERLNAELTFDNSHVRFEKFSGRSSRGAVIGSGFIELGPNWQVDTMHYDISFTGATINPQPEIYAVAAGQVMLDWATGRPLVLTGTVDVSEALIAIGFGAAPATNNGEPDTLFEYDIRVRADRGIWLRNSMVDIELGMDLTLRKSRADQVYAGELESRQGNVYYLDNTLRVSRGRIRFPNIARLNPELDIVAELPVRPARDSSSSMPEKVVLTVSGTLEQPLLQFASEPPGWDEADIASYLNLSMTPGQISALEERDAVTQMLSQRLLSYFQTQAAKRARGFANLDYLEIESGLLSGREARVTVGKYVGRRVYVSYTQNFTGDMQPLFRVEYYINRKNELVAERNDFGRFALRYRLKIRY